jgi:hypothetical protein
MVEHKLVDGVKIELTSAEIAQRKAEEDAWKAGAFDRAIAGLRQRRNALLASSDWTVLSDSPLSETEKTAWLEYRQDLRDITKGVDTEAKVKAVIFPVKP